MKAFHFVSSSSLAFFPFFFLSSFSFFLFFSFPDFNLIHLSFSRFTIHGLLGYGTYGQVVLCKDEKLVEGEVSEQMVALKVAINGCEDGERENAAYFDVSLLIFICIFFFLLCRNLV